MVTIARKVMWIGRAGVLLVGLASELASAHLAVTVIGARFGRGKTNTVNALSRLVGKVARPSLQVDDSTAVGATALGPQVEPGIPPFRVDSTTEAHGLNVDPLDGKTPAIRCKGLPTGCPGKAAGHKREGCRKCTG